ncbi:trypsin-like peptidase domain-containing protein [Microtetraspora sp. AC03309]|uniref:trypsin-like peptidase domain-containing protein n=1 Tax=Microtetraspora sp. AC03309 TaxID=2779376 RepID=UPI001E534DF0|nr:trypsin-like peptidase domain-containing protein [Microtetraspora sp. AC03309]
MNGYFRTLIRGLAATAAIALLAVAAATAPAAAADGDENVSVGTLLAAQTHPAVQLTSLTFAGEVVVPTADVRQSALNELVSQIQVLVAAGKIPSDEPSMYKYMFKRMAADVNKYLVPTAPNRTVEARVGGMCTGWWVTPDGYMVTGAHCVEMSDEELSQTFAQQALQKFNEEDAKEVISGLENVVADEELVAAAQQVYINFNSAHMKLENLQKSLSVLQSLPGGGVDKTAKEVPAELVSVGESYPGKDFALLKVNNQQNLPTVPLGDDADVQTGNTLYISGFPGLVTNTPFFSIESKLDPAMTEGPYNARRTTTEGVPYIQTQAPSYHGNSGGPVFSREGKVIGMLIAGTVSDGGEASENESFVLPVSIIKEKLNEKNIKPAASLTTTRYNEALDAFFAKHYKDALPLFREVQTLHPNHPYVAKYITDSQQAISNGKDETPQPIWLWIAIGAGVLILVAGGFVLLATLRRRKRSSATPAPSYDRAYGGAYPAAISRQDERQAWPQTPQQAPQQAPQRYALPQGPSAQSSSSGQSAPSQGQYPQQQYGRQHNQQGYDQQGYDQRESGRRQYDQYGQPNQAPDGATQYVRPAPQAAPQGPERNVADLEREVEELRRRLGQRQPPDA